MKSCKNKLWQLEYDMGYTSLPSVVSGSDTVPLVDSRVSETVWDAITSLRHNIMRAMIERQYKRYG